MKVPVALSTVMAVLLGCSAVVDEEARIEPFGPEWSVTENQPCHVWNRGGGLGEPFSWSGACVDGKASGEGRLVFRAGGVKVVYNGGMQAGKLHGQGTMIADDGSRYEGGFYRGARAGHGILVYIDGSRYEGAWGDGRRHGRGTFIWASGDAMTCLWLGNEVVPGTCDFH